MTFDNLLPKEICEKVVPSPGTGISWGLPSEIRIN
jgi:hypothetical protein